MSFPNVWHHRKVAETAAKGCDICYKQSTSVLVTPEKQDFFYVCPSHLKDTRFCTPVIDQEAIAARKKKEMDDELERVTKEYEEKKRKKEQEKAKGKEDEKGKSKDGDGDKESKPDSNDKDESKLKDQKVSPSSAARVQDNRINDTYQDKTDVASPRDEEPRVFALHRDFYQQRVERKRQAEMAKRNRERLSNPNFFPSVPKGAPGA